MQDSREIELDRFDHAILAALSADARISLADLAPKVGLSSTACARRLKSLEDQGAITGYHAALDHKRLGLAATVLVRIQTRFATRGSLRGFRKGGGALRLGHSLLFHVGLRRL